MKFTIDAETIILFLLSLLFFFLGLKYLLVDIPAGGKVFAGAHYLGQPVVLSENEGRLIVVTGALKVTEPAFDERSGMTIYASRIYVTEYDLVWDQSSKKHIPEPGGYLKEHQGKTTIGDFTLTSALVDKLFLENSYKDFDAEEMKAGGFVLTEHKNMSQKYFLENHKDLKAYNFAINDLDKSKEKTIIARQKGQSLDYDADVGVYSIIDGSFSSVKELNKYVSKWNLFIVAGLFTLAIILLVINLWRSGLRLF